MERRNSPPADLEKERVDLPPAERLASIKKHARADAWRAKGEFKQRPDMVEPEQLMDLVERYKIKTMVRYRGFTNAETTAYDEEFRDAWQSPHRDV
jgi:hypothetical protein